jgi:hypothetical protein
VSAATRCCLAIMLAAGNGQAFAASRSELPQAGAYEVAVSLRLPHIEGDTATKTETICLHGAGWSTNRGLAVLSDNNALAKCPIINLRNDRDRLTFDIVCEGPNAPRATASYSLKTDAFDGRIAMNMGGKNMTMTELQSGKRIGDCAAPQDRGGKKD